MRRTMVEAAAGTGATAASAAGNRVRGLALVWTLLLAAPAAAAALATDPAAFVFSAAGDLFVGNATRVPGPVAANGDVLLDERVRVAAAIARRDVKLRLLAEVSGDALAVGGTAQLSNQAHVGGTLAAERGVVVGVSAWVDGNVIASRGGVRIVRLAQVAGDVYADREFRGERDVVVGSPGARLEVRGDAVVRDRSHYFATVLHERAFTVLGTGAPVFHAPVVAVSPGTLASPGMPAWKLGARALAPAAPGTADVAVAKADGVVVLPPGRYRTLTLGQQARVVLVAGRYDLEELEAQSDARIHVDVAGPGAALDLRVRRDVRPGRRVVLDLGTGDAATRRARAARVRTVAGGTFRGDQDVVWAGAVLAGRGITLGKHTTLVGAAWTAGDLEVGRDAVVDWVPLPAD